MQQQPEVRKKQTEGISNNLEAFTTKMTRSSSKNQEVPVSCDFLNRDRTREQRRIPHCKPCNGRSSRKCHSQTQTIPSKKASAGNCLPMPSLPGRKRLPAVPDASVRSGAAHMSDISKAKTGGMWGSAPPEPYSAALPGSTPQVDQQRNVQTIGNIDNSVGTAVHIQIPAPRIAHGEQSSLVGRMYQRIGMARDGQRPVYRNIARMGSANDDPTLPEIRPLGPCQLVVVKHPAVKSEITSIARRWAQYHVFGKNKSNNTYKRSNNRTSIINMIYHIKHLLTAQIHALQSNNSFLYISNKYIKHQCNFTSQIRKNGILAIRNTTNH